MSTHIEPSFSVETIADELAEQEFSIVDDFLSREEVLALNEAFSFHREQENFHRAGVGNAHLFHVDKQVRGDYIKWLDPEEALPAALNFLTKIQELMEKLNQLLFLSLKVLECHYAIYPPGTFYEKHLDQFKTTNNRKISFACYLNQNWQPGDGGELRLFRESGHLDVEPVAGRIALFRSDTVEHEVLKTHKDRYSITGWMRDRPLDIPFF